MRYFTVKDGALVTRFGTGAYLGAVLSIVKDGPDKGQTRLTWTPGEVVVLPDEEVARYQREYDSLLAEGSLVESDEGAHRDWVKASEAATNHELAERQAAAKKLEDEAKVASEKAEAAKKKAADEAVAARKKAADEAEAAKKKAADEAAKKTAAADAASKKTEG